MLLTVPATNLSTGDIVTAEFKYAHPKPDMQRSGHVVHVDADDGVLVDFGPIVGHRAFREDGNERTSSRWGARIVCTEQ